MTSQARIDANRQNAQKSTGTKSKEGKERSRRNALDLGLRAEEGDGRELRAAPSNARVNSSKRVARMQRYESAHSSDLHRCLHQLKARVAAPNEPNAPAQPSYQKGAKLAIQHQAITPWDPDDASSTHDPAIQDPSPTKPVPAAPNEPNAAPAPAAPNEPNAAPSPAAPNEPNAAPSPAAPNEPNAPAQAQARRAPASQARSERLEINPAVSGRWPVVRGTTITVEAIATRRRPPHDQSPAQVVAEYDGRLTREDVRAARACWAELTDSPST